MCVHPGMIPAVTRESRDTVTGGVGVCVHVHPGMIPE